MAPFLDGAWPHLEAKPNGLREHPARDDPCLFLVFEDCGTIGLEGDPGQCHKEERVKNGFFTFLRTEGDSDKSETDRGRWGVGKTVGTIQLSSCCVLPAPFLIAYLSALFGGAGS